MYVFITLPMEERDDLLQEHMGVGMAPTLGTKRMSGSHRMKEVY